MNWVYLYSARIIEWMVGATMLVASMLVNNVSSDFAWTSVLIVGGLLALFFVKKIERFFIARACGYSASAFVAYLFAASALEQDARMVVNGALLALVAFLMLSIRMTRREEFRLDTQDLLVLLLVLVVPQLPLKTLDSNDIGLVSLQLAALMYSCEFVLGKAKTNFNVLIFSSIISLLIVGLPTVANI